MQIIRVKKFKHKTSESKQKRKVSEKEKKDLAKKNEELTMQKYMEVHFADEESKKSEASTKDESSSESENDEDEIEGVSLTINFDFHRWGQGARAPPLFEEVFNDVPHHYFIPSDTSNFGHSIWLHMLFSPTLHKRLYKNA